MKYYIGKEMKGFKFGNGTTGVYYHKSMDKNLGKIGKIIDQDSISVKVRFDDNVCFYPLSLAEHHIVTDKDKQKQLIIEIMKGDEELNLYGDKKEDFSQAILEFLLWHREHRKDLDEK